MGHWLGVARVLAGLGGDELLYIATCSLPYCWWFVKFRFLVLLYLVVSLTFGSVYGIIMRLLAGVWLCCGFVASVFVTHGFGGCVIL